MRHNDRDSRRVYLVENPPDHPRQVCLVVLDDSTRVGATSCGNKETIATRPPWIVSLIATTQEGDIVGIAPDGTTKVTFTAADGRDISAGVTDNVFHIHNSNITNVALPRDVSYSQSSGATMHVRPHR